MSFGYPPFNASDEQRRAFAQNEALWMRLLAEVVHNPKYTNADGKRESYDEYYNHWKPYRDKWLDDGVFATRQNIEPLNGHIARANGLAQAHLKGFTSQDLIRGVDVAQGVAQTVSDYAPGGPPPSDASALGPLGIKKSTLVVGAVLLASGVALKLIFR